MNDEMNNELNTQTNDNTTDYITEIQNLRANTVSKDDYQKLRDENKRLISSLARGEYTQEEKPAVKTDINNLRKALNNQNISNLDYVKTALELRQAVIDEGGTDPFLPVGHKIVPTIEDTECANRVAAVFQECIDYADGDSQLFTNELMRRTIESRGMRR